MTCNIWSVFIKSTISMHLLDIHMNKTAVRMGPFWIRRVGVYFFYYYKCFLLTIRIKRFETECKMIVFAFSYDNTPSEDLEIIVF